MNTPMPPPYTEFGNIYWKNNEGQFHRDDGPAVIEHDGGEWWYCRGQLHRIGGPAICGDGNEWWYQYGQRHRVDGPAIVGDGYGPEYWINGYHIRSADEYQRLTGMTDEEVLLMTLKYGGFTK